MSGLTVAAAPLDIDLEAGQQPVSQKSWSSRSYSLCGRCQVWCIETPMVIGEAVGFAGAAYFAWAELTVAAVTSGVPGVACLIAHYLVRKYGNQSLLMQEETQVAGDIRASLAVQVDKVNALAQDLQSAKETNAKSSEQIAQLDKSNVTFASQVAAAMGTVKQFTSENESLKKTIAGLQGDLQQLTQSKGDIAKWTADYSQQNSALKQDLDQLVATLPSLQGLQGALTAGGKPFAAVLQEFAQKIQESRALSDTIIQNVQAQNNRLTAEMERLSKTCTELMETEQKTRAELAQVTKTVKGQDAQTPALQALEAALKKHQSEDAPLMALLTALKARLDALTPKSESHS